MSGGGLMGESGFTNCDVVAEIVCFFLFFLTIQLLQNFLFGLGFFFFFFFHSVCLW